MKILKIIVDVLPSKCSECRLMIYANCEPFCMGCRKHLWYNISNETKRHKDCPLEIELNTNS